jgi:hypothetical protein
VEGPRRNDVTRGLQHDEGQQIERRLVRK